MKKLLKWIWYNRGPIPVPWYCSNNCFMLLGADDMGWSLIKGNYEKEIVQWVKKNMRSGGLCVDAGANQGFYTLLFSSLGLEVFAFEPNRSEMQKLIKNIAINSRRLKGEIHLIRSALGDFVGVRKFRVVKRRESRGSFELPPEEVKGDYSEEEVPVAILDGFDRWRKIDVLKIDVEGAELEVLKGGFQRIRLDSPLIIVEIADVATQQFGYKAEELLKWLEKVNYRVEIEEKDWYRDTVIAFPRGYVY